MRVDGLKMAAKAGINTKHMLYFHDMQIQIQIHKYTNKILVRVADRPNMCYIFENVMVRGPQKTMFPRV